MNKYRIRSQRELDDDDQRPLYWSNYQGWVSRESATLFGTTDVIPRDLGVNTNLASAGMLGDWEPETVSGCSACGSYGLVYEATIGWHTCDSIIDPDAQLTCERCGAKLTLRQLLPPTVTPDNQYDDAMSKLRLGVVAMHRALSSAGRDELEDVPRAVIGTHLQVIEQSLEALTELAGEYQLTR